LKEIVIQPYSADSTSIDYMIDIDPVFANSRKSLWGNSNSVDDKFVEEINKCIVNMQIEALYNSVSRINQKPVLLPEKYSFYSEPETRVILDKYIELPTMGEVFKEIVPTVNVITRNNVSSFRVIGVSGTIKNYFTIVDGIYIKDVNRIVEMNPEDIKQIEVINRTYFVKDLEIGAIISIQTKKGDLSAMNFDNRIFRQEFHGYEFSFQFSAPDYSIDSVYTSPRADFRNLLYWNPDMKFDEEGSGQVKFYTSDDSGDYVISVEGIQSDGKKQRLEVPFSVVN
jgi:hypothetical protein